MYARGRRTTAWDVTLDTTISVGSDVALPVERRKKAAREGTRSRASAAGAVPDGEVARAACRHGAEDGSLDVGLQSVRGGRGAAHAHLRRAAGAAADRDHDRHPL